MLEFYQAYATIDDLMDADRGDAVRDRARGHRRRPSDVAATTSSRLPRRSSRLTLRAAVAEDAIAQTRARAIDAKLRDRATLLDVRAVREKLESGKGPRAS